jgi:hypothetical protein
MAIQNSMYVNGKGVDFGGGISDIGGPGLNLNLADDFAEVRGYGQPVTKAAAYKMATDYFSDCLAVIKLVKDINANVSGEYASVKAHPSFSKLAEMMDIEKHVVSGVFGKEIILQLLSQKNAEGIRYTIGKFDGKITVLITAVSEHIEDGTDQQGNPIKVTMSDPLGSYKLYQENGQHNPNDPPDAEVHGGSKTIAELLAIYQKRYGNALENKGDISKILFGEY